MTRHDDATPGPGGHALSPQPARQQAVLRHAERLGRRHGKAAVYWQIGGNGTQESCRHLLHTATGGDAQTPGLYEMPKLAAEQDYDRDSLAADLGLAPGAPALAQAAQVYRAAAREEFWLEAARLARRHLRQPPSRPAGQGGGAAQDITDPATGLSRLLTEPCSTCILRPGDLMHLGPEHTARFVRHALAEGTYVVCHLH
jgi:hypothetical protein